MEYQKRPGTSGIDGQFYETKLLALILFRLQHDRTVQYFHLATNINDLGDFDDICLVVKTEGYDRPIAVFVQLKHKENDKAVIKFDNKDKLKYVTSFIKITKRIASRQPCDDFFDGNLNEADCLFILYTNAKFSITNSELKFEKSYASVLNNLLATSDTVGCRAQESNQILEDLEDHFLKNDLVLLSEHFVEFLIDKGPDRSMHIMNDECVQQYDVILSRKVFDISGVQTDKHKPDLKWRILTFQRDFFTSNEKYVLIFRNQLFKELLRKQREKQSKESTTSRPSSDETISLFLTAPSVATLTPLILTHIDCNEVGRLEFLIKRPACDTELLQQTHMSLYEIDEAILAAKTSAMKYLLSLELKVPIAFGNIDLAIRGSENKINRRLKFLTTAICDLCKDYEQEELYKIVKIDGYLDKALLDRNGGLASAVGNMLTYDENTNMLKFSTTYTSEQKIAEQLFINLRELIDDILKYRFVVKTKKFPKLHFDCTDTAREFLSKLIIYEKQSNHWQVEEILKEKIEESLIADSQHSMKYTNISVFLHYHEEILKWWILPTTGIYLNKMTNLYEQAMYNMEVEPQISTLQTMVYIGRAKYFKTSFTEQTMKWTEQPELPSKLFITTDTVALTTVKILQCLRTYFLNSKFAVLDFEFILNLTIKDFDSLKAEMKNTEKKLIIMWHRIQNNNDSSNIDDRLSTIALATKEKQLVIVINGEFKEIIKEHFCSAHDVFYDETESLSNIKSQKEITKHANVIFQGQKVTLDMILDDESVSFVKGGILDKVMRNETMNIGEELSNVEYEEIKDFYVDRSVRHSKNNDNNNDDASDEYDNIFTWNYNDDLSDNSSNSSDDNVSSDYEYTSKEDSEFASYSTIDNAVLNKFILLKSFFDIHSSVVLLTAPPGMGKSTLLTHLSLNTKEQDVKLWIVRVNFRDYSKQFCEWYEDDIVVDALESLNLLCKVVLKNDTISFDIEITDGEAHLVSNTDDESANFELNMFLHFYNQSRLIFVFDGFDEICPYYKDKVVSFLTIVKDDLRKYKMWVTSRPYSEILPDLETVLGRCFKINSLSFTEQETYLRRFWNKKLLFKKPTDKQLKNLRTFFENTRESIYEYRTRNWVRRIYSVFLDTVRPLICQTISNVEIDELKAILNSSRMMDSKRKINRLSGIPLLLYFLGDYFVNKVATDTKRSKTILDFNLPNVYEMFIENKVKKVLFENKNKMDLSNTITRRLLEKELYDCISIHKKLAAYTFYQDLTIQNLDLEELKDMKPLNEQEWYNELEKIKTGSEKTGLISHVTTHNVPVFIHKSFTEYFIAEYICDIIKSDKFKLFQKVLWYCVIMEINNTAVRDWMDRKKETDPKFRHALVEMKNMTPIYKTKYHLFLNKENMSKRQYIRILASSVNDYEDECFSDYGEKIIKNYGDKFNFPIKQELNEYFTNYCISKMKPCLRQHFEGPILFEFRETELNFVRDFNLAKHNMVQLDSVILKLKIKGHMRSVPLFMLLIHEAHCDTFQASNTEIMYKNCQNIPNDNISQIDFVFIQFPRRFNPGYDIGFSTEIKQFLATTSTIGNRLHYSEQHLNDFAEKMLEKEFIQLAGDLEMFLIQTEYISIEMMLNMYVKQYHVILRQHVFDITDIQRDENNFSSEWRTVTFRNDFFYTNDRHIALLRNCLFKQMLNKGVLNTSSQFLPDQLIPIFLAEPSVTTLAPLFGSYIIGCEDNKLKFNIERPPSDVEQLRRINIPQSTIEEAMFAVRIAAMIYLRSLQLKVSVDFGNIDLSRGDHLCFKSDSEYLKKAIVKLCQKSTSHKVVTIDNTLDELLLQPSGGLGNCVGNILIYDEETEMLKVQNLDQFTPAQENAKSLYLQLSHEIDNLHEYRFRVKTWRLPKCHLDFDNFARQILRRLVIFTEQSNYYELEEILTKGDKYRPGLTPYHALVQNKLEQLHCHGEVLKWWRTSNIGECDINLCDLYQQAMNNIKLEPEISGLYTSFYLNNLKYFRYIFNENATESMEVPVKHSKCIIVTETVILTTIKVLRRLMCDRFNNEYTVLDLKHMLGRFSNMRDNSLLAELWNTKKVLIFVCTQISDDATLDKLAQLSKHKRLIIIANQEFRARVESHSEWSDVVFESEIESLSTIQSYKEIARETTVIFQGQKVSLDVIVDDKSVSYVKGDVLGKMINNDIVYIGRTISNAQYNKVKDSLIDKKVGPLRRDDDEHETSSVIKVMKTFYDILDDVVLLIAPTGTGKSTLLTHLSLNTIKINWKLWIVRVNFTDHMEQFNKWADENTPVDTLETLKFLCRITLNNKITSFNVALTNNKAHLVNCVGDDLATFELNLFLHFYNEEKVIFVFDAVDEIDPYCKDKVFQFLTVVRTRLLKSKMWVTSKSYSEILPDLQGVLGEGFKIES